MTKRETNTTNSATQERVRDRGLGEFSPTVSAPGIHYTTTIDAKAFFGSRTCIFLAFNSTFDKRILHPLELPERVGTKQDFFEQRPLYLEDNPLPWGTASIFELITDKFADEPVSLHLYHPQYRLSNLWCLPQISVLQEAMQTLSSKLSFTPVAVESWDMHDPPEYHVPSVPRVIRLTYVDSDGISPVVIDKRRCLLHSKT